MANTTHPNGFTVTDSNPIAVAVRLTSSITIVAGDPLWVGADGYANTTQAAGTFIGISASTPIDANTGRNIVTSSSTAGTDYALVYPADKYTFEGQILLGAVTDPYVLSTSAYDLVFSSGSSYITASSSTYDTALITGVASEWETGKKSQPGDYQKVFWKAYNPRPINSTVIKDLFV